jgi:hypothetical protein
MDLLHYPRSSGISQAQEMSQSAVSSKDSAWIPLAERKPEHEMICLIAGEGQIGLAEYDAKFPEGWWNACGVCGYDWEWGFEPTHWMPLTITLPKR